MNLALLLQVEILPNPPRATEDSGGVLLGLIALFFLGAYFVNKRR